MDARIVVLVVSSMSVAIFLLFLVLFFSVTRLWIQALLTRTPVGVADIIRMRLTGCPPELIVQTMIALNMRGVKVSADEMMSCYLGARNRGEPVTNTTELAELMKEKLRDESRYT